jgi:hypothetical protein
LKSIESNSENRETDLKEILEIADKITKEELEFTTNRASNNRSQLKEKSLKIQCQFVEALIKYSRK